MSASATSRFFWPPTFTYFDVYGPVIMGGGSSCLLLGIILISAYNYFDRYKEDKTSFKLFIALVCLLTTVDTAMLWAEVVKLASRPGDFFYALQVQAGHLGWARSISASICAFLVQCYMIHTFFTFALALRYQDGSSWKKGAIKAFGVLLTLVALLGLVASWIAPVYAEQIIKDVLSNRNNVKKAQALSFTWQLQYGSMLAVDTILTVIFSIYLHTVRTGFSTTNNVINALMVILLRNGLLVTSMQLASLLLYTLSSSYWITFPGAFASKLYVLTLLSLVTKPRAVQRRTMEESFRAPPGVSRPISGSDHIASTGLSSSSGQYSRNGGLPVTPIERQRSANVSRNGHLSFSEFLDAGEDHNQITPTEDEEWIDGGLKSELEGKPLVKELAV